MNAEELGIAGVLLLKPLIHRDARGHFFELWHRRRYSEAGLTDAFVQDNVSVSVRGVLRGLHFQHPKGQAKLVSVVVGEVFDVAVDVRVDSPTFGKWTGATLSDENGWQTYIPAGFAHGFLTLSPRAVCVYKCTAHHAPDCEQSIRWDDPAIGIPWPATKVRLSHRDQEAPLLSQIPRSSLPAFRAQEHSIGHEDDSRP